MRKQTYLVLNLVVGVIWLPVAVVALRWSTKHLGDSTFLGLPGYVGAFALVCAVLVLSLFLLSWLYQSSRKTGQGNQPHQPSSVGLPFLGWCLFLILACCVIYTVLNEPN
jgi:hypothetical protein